MTLKRFNDFLKEAEMVSDHPVEAGSKNPRRDMSSIFGKLDQSGDEFVVDLTSAVSKLLEKNSLKFKSLLQQMVNSGSIDDDLEFKSSVQELIGKINSVGRRTAKRVNSMRSPREVPVVSRPHADGSGDETEQA